MSDEIMKNTEQRESQINTDINTNNTPWRTYDVIDKGNVKDQNNKRASEIYQHYDYREDIAAPSPPLPPLLSEPYQQPTGVVDHGANVSMNSLGNSINEEVTDETEPNGGHVHSQQEGEPSVPDNDVNKTDQLKSKMDINIPVMYHHEKACQYHHSDNKRSIPSGSGLQKYLTASTSVKNPYQCHYENKSAQLTSLKTHMAHHSGEKPNQRPQCEYKSVHLNALDEHIIAHHTGEKSLQCPHCEYESVTLGHLNEHIMARHAGEKPHRCPHCEFKSVFSRSLRVHTMARHTCVQPHQCPHCAFKSVNLRNLIKHIVAHHTGVKPHQCPHCDYKSVVLGSLNQHIMSQHSGEKPHQCSRCEFKSVHLKSLYEHLMYHHTGVELYRCPHCEFISVHLGSINLHIMSHHTGEKPHQCPHCEYKGVQKGDLSQHIMARHTDD
ncbi:gastrula zinc finger protein XlCGF57.1 [Halyomorpha halys]|uniref:gastrula zinc finger protein XlCGF57.1 n=1 Tax=Halyomorpha halys TaxID=286706 RepID=UPI0006D50685